ncbi:hypothetical protein ABGB07_03830 [Micromonosporaceae bacterium B7E4]
MLQLVLYIAALVLLILAAFNVSGRINTLAAGMACWLTAVVFVPML